MLSDNKINLRTLEPADIDILYKWENNTEIWEVSNTVTPFSKYILEKYIENSHVGIFASQELRLIIETQETGKIVGCIDLFDYEPIHLRAGVGILINEKKDREKGYAEASLKLIIKYASEVLFLNQLYCNISEDNIKSLNLFQKLGFKITGTKKQWINTGTDFKDEHFLQCTNINEQITMNKLQ